MSAFIGYGDIGVWCSNRDRDDFLDWFAENRCAEGDSRWEDCKSDRWRWTGSGVELSELLKVGETIGLTGDEYDQAAKSHDLHFAQLLGVIESITRGECKPRVGDKPANTWYGPVWSRKPDYDWWTDLDGLCQPGIGSPFPGMDPYLEQYWAQVRTPLAVYACEQLTRDLPTGFVASTDCKIEKDVRHDADVNIARNFIKILDPSNYIITQIEFIDHDQACCREQPKEELQSNSSSIVEIDLHSRGLNARIRRAWSLSIVEVQSFSLRKLLPVIPIPLRQTDADVGLRLQYLVQRCHIMGRYDIDYQKESDPPLQGADAEWADALLRAAGKRK